MCSELIRWKYQMSNTWTWNTLILYTTHSKPVIVHWHIRPKIILELQVYNVPAFLFRCKRKLVLLFFLVNETFNCWCLFFKRYVTWNLFKVVRIVENFFFLLFIMLNWILIFNSDKGNIFEIMYPDKLKYRFTPTWIRAYVIMKMNLYRIHCENPLVYPRQCIQTNH